ncbi:hypothetical protein ACQVBX_09340 [Dyella sp. KULCS107]|uniref:hypothetical protein n=1 Tax=Dyella sp. KULCS107 TaxID=3422216 RepID=UPI003D6F2094
MSNLDAQNKVAGLFVDLVAARAGTGRAVHAETAIAAAARLSGSLLLRSFNLDINKFEPGSVLLSEKANEEGPQLINILGSMLQNFGVVLDKSKIGGSNALRGEEPKLSVVQSLVLLQEDAVRIAEENRLSLKEAAQSAAMGTAFIVKECAGKIGAEVSFNVALYGVIEGSKTVPPRLQLPKKPSWKFW